MRGETIFIRLVARHLAVFILVWAVLSCHGPAQASDRRIIGFSLGTLREERWLKDQQYFTEKAKALGADVNFQFAGNDIGRQISQAENLILQKVDVLVVLPQDSYAASVIVEMAHRENIKVIAYDRLINNCDLDAYLSFDNIKVGEFQARGVLQKVRHGNFAYIGGSPADNNAILIKEGAMRVLQPFIDRKDIYLVVDAFSKDWKPDEAYKTIKAYLKQGKKLDAVVAANDGTAFGTIQALSEFGLAGKVPVSGQDAELAACRRIVKGTQTVTVYKPIKALAEKAAEVAVALATGQEPRFTAAVNNGQKEVSSFLITPIMVTRDNLKETVIADGFHRLEDVYR